MADTNKEIAAILAEMRCDNQLANSLTASQLSAFLRYADRIEAAVKREIAQWRGETNAAKEERNRIACKMRYEFAAKCRACKSAHGNAAAMREALKESTMPSPTLKPCPFCGEDEEVSTSERNYGLFVGEWEFFDVECNNCGCSLSIGAPSRDEAIAAWNRRAGEDKK